MKRMARFKPGRMVLLAALLLSGFLLSACASKITEVEKVSLDDVRQHSRYENVVLRKFVAPTHLLQYKDSLSECRHTAMVYLQEKAVFKRVEKESDQAIPGPTLFVDTTLIDMKIVHTSTRVLGGVFAGRSYMKILVRLTDSAGAVVAEQELEGAPNSMGSSFSYGASDRSLPRHMGMLLGDFILAQAVKK